MKIREKLLAIQTELKAPKGQYNSYGKYNYRSCEDILEAVKPLLAKYKCTLTIHDDIALVGERYYIKATASLLDAESPESIGNVAYARESLDKKGMDDSQITGTASSYARKYCLNGLFLIDDTKDADTDEYKAQSEKKEKVATKAQSEKKEKMATESQINQIRKLSAEKGKVLDEEALANLTMKTASDTIEYLNNLEVPKNE